MKFNLIEDIKVAFANLFAMGLRTILAMLGILVGTASVVVMVSAGQMATEQALAQFKVLGTDMMAVAISEAPSGLGGGGAGEGGGGETKDFTVQEALSMQTAAKSITKIAPYVMAYSPITYRGNMIQGSIIGVTHDSADVVRLKIIKGRYISDLDGYQPFCVIGNAIYQDIKKYGNDPIGSQIRLGESIFTIIGVLDVWPENAFFYQDINHAVLIPIHTASLLSKYAKINNIIMRLSPTADITTVQQDITDYMKKVAPGSNLFFRSAKELIKSMSAQRQVFTLLLSAIGGVSLLVGGIGVMNIMLVSVLERRREIGIRLALGARRGEIQRMFLLESVALSLLGGIFGIILGILCAFIIAYFAKWQFAFYFLPPAIGFTVSVLIGIFFGFYPARQASKLDPIQTLRAE